MFLFCIGFLISALRRLKVRNISRTNQQAALPVGQILPSAFALRFSAVNAVTALHRLAKCLNAQLRTSHVEAGQTKSISSATLCFDGITYCAWKTTIYIYVSFTIISHSASFFVYVSITSRAKLFSAILQFTIYITIHQLSYDCKRLTMHRDAPQR